MGGKNVLPAVKMSSVGPGESTFLICPVFVRLKLQEYHPAQSGKGQKKVVRALALDHQLWSRPHPESVTPLASSLLLVVAHPEGAGC